MRPVATSRPSAASSKRITMGPLCVVADVKVAGTDVELVMQSTGQ